MEALKKKFSFLDNKLSDVIVKILLAFIAAFQVGYLMSLAAPFGAAWGISVTLSFAGTLVLLFYIEKFVSQHKDDKHKKRVRWAVVLSILFALTYVLGYQLQYVGNTLPGVKGKAAILLHSIGFLPLMVPLFYLLLYFVDHSKHVTLTGKAFYSGKKIFFIAWAVILVSWIPAFLAYYPMIMSYDFHAQVLYSAIGFEAFSNHHPYLSTMEISAFYHIGLAIGNTQTGIALMGIFHMLINSAGYAYAVYVLSKLLPFKQTPFIATAVMALFPTHPVMILSTTKDVIFSLFFLLFICVIFERVFFADTKGKRIKFDIFIVITGIMACLWRNNTVYAVVVAGILITIFTKGRARLLILAAVILIAAGYKGGYTGLRKIVGDDSKTYASEMLSVYVQAYGRTVYKNQETIDPRCWEIITYYLPEYCIYGYNTGISDALKAYIPEMYDHYEGHWSDVIKDFIYVGVRYPNEYIDSFLDLTRGYWFMDDTSFADVLGEGYEGRMGIIYTYNSSESWMVDEIKHETKFPLVERFYESIISEDVVLRMPVVNLLFKISFFTMSTLLMALLFIYKKDYKSLKLIAFSVMYILTMFLGPVVQFRYAYPWIITFGFFVLLFFIKKPDEVTAEE